MNTSKTKAISLGTLLILISGLNLLFAQEFDVPRSSPKASVSQHIGVTNIAINYCRPSVNKRKIFGELIPFGKVWRTGANEATTISFPHDVKIEGNSINAGKYSIFTIPGKDQWTIIINNEWKQWGAYDYQPEQDVLRFDVKPGNTDFTELFTISFAEVSNTLGVLSMQWENTMIQMTIETDTKTNTLADIDKMTKELGANWYAYSAAAQYHFYKLKNTEEAIDLINVAIAMEAPNPSPWMLKSQILAYEHKYKEAIEQAQTALEICKSYNFDHEIHENEAQIKKWSALLNK